MKINEKVTIIIVLVLIVAVIATTWAFFGAEIIEMVNNPTEVTTGTVKLNVSDDVVNVSNLNPIYDSMYEYDAYRKDFSVNVSSDSLNACTKLYLNLSDISDALKSKYFKWKIVGDNDVEAEGTFENASSGSEGRIVLLDYAGYVKPNEPINYTLYLWISYSDTEDQMNMLNTNLTSNIVVEGYDSKYESSCTGVTLTQRILIDNEAFPDNEASTYVTATTGINFGAKSSDTNGKGLYYTETNTDENGDGKNERIYYFRGEVENNYLVFAGYCWRIVRTNENGSVKLRYGGVPTITDEATTCPEKSLNSHIETETAFNTTKNSAKYVGYTYGDTSNASGTQMYGTTDSNIKEIVDVWYENSIASKGIDITNKIADTIYCNDRSINSTSGSITVFGASDRIQSNKSPQYVCPDPANDGYTLKIENGGTVGYGNNLLTYPIALLTADEISYAGAVYGSNYTNSNFYLHTNERYWTMSPYYYNTASASGALEFFLYNTGYMGNNLTNVSSNFVVPAISLIKEVGTTGGTGLYNDPYVVG